MVREEEGYMDREGREGHGGRGGGDILLWLSPSICIVISLITHRLGLGLAQSDT